jgi:type I restriction enzyme R subunit
MTPLSEVIAELNDRFGLGLRTSDEILVYQQVVGLVEDTSMQQIALMNDEARFGQVADDRLDDIVAENAERNTDFMKLYFDNDEFQKAIKEAARKRVPDHHRAGAGRGAGAAARGDGAGDRWA